MRNHQGFTLIEILVVTIIIGILASVGLSSFIGSIHVCFRDSSSCLNEDPISKKCHKKVKTREENTQENILVELRYSPKCHMTWARSTAPPGSKIYVVDSAGKAYGEYRVGKDGYTQHYGDMGPGYAVAACAQLPDSNLVCTPGSILVDF